MKYKTIICRYCKKVAQVPTLRKEHYCDNCKAIAHNNAVKNSAIKKKENEAVKEKEVTAEEYDATKYMRKDELKELCKRYDDLRRDFIYFWQKSSKDAKYYTKTGDMLLHELEFCNPTDTDIVKKARLVQSDRAIRRGMKVSSLIAFPIVCSFGLRNATGFLELAIDGAKKEKDLQAYLDNIKYNKEIYSRALKREEVEEENE